jgi:putative peptidoglycan lipid II flippase
MYRGTHLLNQGLQRIVNFFKRDGQFQVQLLVLMNILLAAVAFLKDILLARYFGTSHYADSLYLAFFLPDTIGNGLLAATIGITCIPVLTKALKNKSQDHYNLIVNKLLLLTLTLAIGLLILLLPGAKWFFSYFNYAEQVGTDFLTYRYFLIMLPIVLLAPGAIVAASILQVSGDFTKPAILPIIFNAILLIGVLVCIIFEYPLIAGGYLYSGALIFSTTLIFFLSWFFVSKVRRISFNPLFYSVSLYQLKNEEFKLFLQLTVPYFAILIFQQVILITERFFASMLETGTISGLTYAFRLSQFPIWVFIAAINTVLLPTISKLKEDVNNIKLKSELIVAFYMTLIISLVISGLFFLFGNQFISLLFMKGAFNQESLKVTNEIFKGYALSILGQSIYLFSIRYFIAFGKMKMPLLTSLIGGMIHIILLAVFVPNMGPKGIGMAAAIGYTLSGGCLLFFLYKDFTVWGKKGGLRNEQ